MHSEAVCTFSELYHLDSSPHLANKVDKSTQSQPLSSLQIYSGNSFFKFYSHILKLAILQVKLYLGKAQAAIKVSMHFIQSRDKEFLSYIDLQHARGKNDMHVDLTATNAEIIQFQIYREGESRYSTNYAEA
jgi:hypothetical protein